MSIKLKRPETIPAALTINGQGGRQSFNITYHNHTQSAFEKAFDAEAEDARRQIIESVLFIVKDWELDTPLTHEGIGELEDQFPGFILGVIQGFHQARQVTLEKN